MLDGAGRSIDKPWAPAQGSRYGAASFAPTFSGVQTEFFNAFCTECHSGAGAPRGLDLTAPALRGIYYEASYVQGRANGRSRPIEVNFPTIKLFNRRVVRVLNALRYAQQGHLDKTAHVMDFHYPVDALKHWNKLYGPKGFQEYQFVVPASVMSVAVTEFVAGCRKCSLVPLFAVIKKFGDMAREGLLSFPKAGFTMMADLEARPGNQGFFKSFTDRVLELEGRIYLAKDSSLVKGQFERMYDRIEQWRAITRRYDPLNKITSNLSARLGMKPW
jgi:hypothetical protein